jgi:hypothetical protein
MPTPVGGTAAGAAGAVPAVSNGVLSKLTHVPRRSGWPSGVRPTVHAFGVWAAEDAGKNVTHATPATKALRTPKEGTRRCLIGRLIGHLRE